MKFSTKYAVGTWRVKNKPAIAFVSKPGNLEVHYRSVKCDLPFEGELDYNNEIELDETKLEPILLETYKANVKKAKKK